MNPRTAEIMEIPDEMRMTITNPYRDEPYTRPKLEPELVAMEEGFVTPEEIEAGVASFETWCHELNIFTGSRQTMRKAKRRYEKALKRLEKKHE